MTSIIRIDRAKPPRLTPAAHRLLSTAIGDARERLGDCLRTSTPPLEVVYLDDGKASVALMLTFDVAGLNAEAGGTAMAEREAAVLAVLTGEWQSAEDVGVASVGWCEPELRALWRAGLAQQVGGMWRRAK
mgnify:CR=1 FL=1